MEMKSNQKIPNIPGISKEKLEALRDAFNAERNDPPKIAVIGECGVGKSSTLNAMFNAGLEISHVFACTQKEHELNIDISEMEGGKGNIIIYDMPGLGEDIDADEIHKQTYKKILASCDVAVWVLDGDGRKFTYTQLALRDVVGTIMGDLDRLVIGINKIDAIRPGEWNTKFNVPSREQEVSIAEKIDDVLSKIGKICPIPEKRIVPYSAEKWYRLNDLFGAMLDACPEERAWVLYDRANVADYTKKIDPEVLRSFNKNNN